MVAEHPHPARKKRPWLLIIGGVLAVLSLLLCFGGGFGVFSGVQDLADQQAHNGSHTVQLDEGESTGVYAENPATTCTATGPDGPVPDSADASETVSWGDTELVRVMEVEATTTGEYTISCSDAFVVGEGLPIGSMVVAIIGGAVCVLASILLIIGVILWAVRRR